MSYSDAIAYLLDKAQREHNKPEADKLAELLKIQEERRTKGKN